MQPESSFPTLHYPQTTFLRFDSYDSIKGGDSYNKQKKRSSSVAAAAASVIMRKGSDPTHNRRLLIHDPLRRVVSDSQLRQPRLDLLVGAGDFHNEEGIQDFKFVIPCYWSPQNQGVRTGRARLLSVSKVEFSSPRTID